MSLYAEVDTEEYYDSIAKALLKKKGSAKFPSNEDVKTALKDKDLYNTQPKNRNYLFELLENYNNREQVNTNNEAITIEHIFPRNPHEQWSTDLSSEEFFLFKEKHLNTIGNLTLSGNKEMNKEGNEQGYSFSHLWLNSYLKKIDNWNIEKFEERQIIIYDRFLKIWEYPAVIITENDDSEEQNIFDAESPRNKKLEYYIFENNKIEEDTVAQMYFGVVRALYEKNSQLLVSSPDVFKITRNSADFRSPQEVANGWFMESNIDSSSKFVTLKRLLTLFEMEDELSVKYSLTTDTELEPSRFEVRKRYWTQLLPLLDNTTLFNNVSASKEQWIASGAGIAGLSYTLVMTKMYVRIELTILTSSKETNKLYFKKLLRNKEAIEQMFGQELEWEELPQNKMSRIKIEKQGVNLFRKTDWLEMNEFTVTNLPEFENALSPFLKNIK